MRKVGVNKRNCSYVCSLKDVGLGKQALSLPPPLLRQLGLRKGQRLKVEVVRGSVKLKIRRTSSMAKIIPLKQSGAARTLFDLKWYQAVHMLQARHKQPRRRIR